MKEKKKIFKKDLFRAVSENRKNGKMAGITLIALVISIIVLLILATVSIQTLTGNNGLLTKTEIAVQSNKDSQEEEKVKLAVAAAQLDGNGTISTQNLGNELKANFDIDSVDLNEKSEGWLFKINKEYTIYKDGKIEVGNLLLLPKEYQQEDYIESTGTQYIDTGVVISKSKLQNGIKTTLEASFISQSSDQAMFKDNISYYFIGVESNGYFYSGLDVNYSATDLLNDGKKHIFELDSLDKTFKIDETIKTTYNVAAYNENSSGNIYLFNVSSGNFLCKAKIYNCKIYDNGILIRNFIPCYSKTIVTDVDGIERPRNTIGLYDTVNGKFYVNKGTGTFFMQTEISEYQQVDYIESTGTQYIDTGVEISKSKLQNGIKTKLEASFISQSSGQAMFKDNISYYFIGVKSNGYFYSGLDVNYPTTDLLNDSKKHIFELDSLDKTFKIDETIKTTYNVAAYNENSSGNIYLFNVSNGNFLCKAKIYNCKIYDDGILIRNFIPCYRKSDNKIGLYDIVERKFYTNQGSGTFIKGNEV